MRKSRTIRFLKKTTGALLLLGGLGLWAASDAAAQEAPTPGSVAAPELNSDNIFQVAGSNLTNELEQLSNECCKTAVAGACNGGAACGGHCGGNCGGVGGGMSGWLAGELGDPWTASDSIWSTLGVDKPLFDVGGWTQFGYHSKSDGIFNTHPNHLDLQQGWLYFERVADGSNGWGIGGRMDLVYGTDAQNTQSFGNNAGRFDFANGWDNGVYGWALPQAYVEVAKGDLSIKAGHFFTLLGYQVVPATGNFFYSIPFTFNFSEAFTHTGALATYKASDRVTGYAGWTLGWDTGFDRFNGGSSFLGGASLKVTDDFTFTYITTFGNLGWIGDGYTHSIVADWVINDKWEYVFQTDLDETTFHPLFGTGYHTIGINEYLYYTVSDKVKAGGRVEWWKANGVSYYEATAGLNITPTANLRIRPEVRYQWAPAATDANVFGIPVNQAIFGVDAILTF